MATNKLDPEEIQAALQRHIEDARNYQASELTPDRVRATKYYRGDPFGSEGPKEVQGRSQFVSTDVRDTVLAMLPSFVRLFLPTSGHVIEYQPRPKTVAEIDQAVAFATQATQMVNEVVLQQDNNGFTELHAAFKDALVRKNGAIKYWWEDRSVYKTYTADNCDVLQYEALVNDPDVEILKEQEHQMPEGVVLRDVEYKHWRRDGVACLSCVPPEEMLISRDARSRENATFIGHQTEKTRADLIAMGVPADEIDHFGGPSQEVLQNQEEIARRGGISHIDQAQTPGEVKHLWIESYPYLDLDGDGEAELVRIRSIGPGYHIVGEPEPVDERPFAFFCPDPEPHVLIGQSVADRVMDLQRMKSSLYRGAADGLSKSLFPRRYFMEGMVDVQAMQSTAMSQDVAVYDGMQPGQAVYIETYEWQGEQCLAFINALDGVKQQRVGPLPATLDPDSLQSTPEIGVKATVQAASEQLELIARVFAATGMQQLGKGLLKLLVEHQPRARIVRLSGQYVAVDPRAWDAEMDVQINVALGTEQKLGVLAMVAQKQEMILSTLGPANPLVTLGQYRNTLAQMMQLQGIPNVDTYWQPIDAKWTPPPQPQSPDPNLLLAQAEMTKAQAKLQKDQADFQIAQVSAAQEMANLRAQLASKGAELALQREKMHLDDERARDIAEADVATKIAIANAQFQSQITIGEINRDVASEQAALERERMVVDLTTAPGNGDTPASESPAPKKRGPKVTTVQHDAQGRIAKLTTQEPE
jgi:hypothetical protein